jgi:hypothetical protein
MLIESLIKRPEGTFVTLGKDVYHFHNHIKGDPRHLCEVADEDHIQSFLAIKEGYKIAKPLKAAAPAAASSAPAKTPAASGSTGKQAGAKGADVTAATAAAAAAAAAAGGDGDTTPAAE